MNPHQDDLSKLTGDWNEFTSGIEYRLKAVQDAAYQLGYLRAKAEGRVAPAAEALEKIKAAIDGSLMPDGLNRSDDGLGCLISFSTLDTNTKRELLKIERALRDALEKLEAC